MTLNKSAVWKAALLSAAIGITFHFVVNVLGATAANAADTPRLVQGVVGITSIVNLAAMLILMVLYGALYGFFARREGSPVEGNYYAFGGALTNVVATLLIAAFLAILALIGLAAPGTIVPTRLAAAIGAALTLAGVVQLAVNAGLGAVGGAIYAAAHKDKVVTTTPTGY